ncbi:MAG: hypothetical protein ABEH80_05270 [Halobaculum sp.]|jgi:hypothetical protein
METWDDLFERARASRSRTTSGSRATGDSETPGDPDATNDTDVADSETSDCVENVRETLREVRRE